MTRAQIKSGSRKWISLVRRITAALCVVILVAALFGIGWLRSNQALKEATAAVTCVNRILGERSALTRRDSVAHIDFARASKSYNEAFATLILDVAQKASKAKTKADFGQVVRQAPLLATATQKYDEILAADQRARDAHPFSKCS